MLAVVLAVIMAASAAILLSPSSDAAEGDVEYDGEIHLYGYNAVIGLKDPQQVETVEWDFGDGSEKETVEITAENPTGEVRHVFAEIGDYTVTATMRNTHTEGGEQVPGETTLTYLIHIHGFPVVTFQSNGGTPVDSVTGTKSTFKVTEPTAPTREGYTFSGWYTDEDCTQKFDFNTTVVRHMTLYAGWTPVTYTVHFDLAGGQGSIEDQTVQHGKTAAEPAAPTKEEYNFAGWMYNGEPWSFTTPITQGTETATLNVADITDLKKGDKPSSLTMSDGSVITFDANGGTAEFSQKTIIAGNSVILPDATREGYTFDGWYSGDTRIGVAGDSIAVNSNITYTAHWTENTPAPGPDDGDDTNEDGFPIWMILAILTVILAIVSAIAYFLNFPYLFILTAISAVATVVCYIMEI